MEPVAQIVFELLGVEALGQRTRPPFLVQIDLKAPVIVHGDPSPTERTFIHAQY